MDFEKGGLDFLNLPFRIEQDMQIFKYCCETLGFSCHATALYRLASLQKELAKARE